MSREGILSYCLARQNVFPHANEVCKRTSLSKINKELSVGKVWNDWFTNELYAIGKFTQGS